MMARTLGFATGMPTEIDVKRLLEEFGVPKEGTLIEYAEIERVLTVSRQASRFWSVTHAWRARLERENNVLLIAEPNQGFRVPTPTERVKYVAGGFRTGVRRIRRSGRRALATEDAGLTSEDRRLRDYVGNAAGVLAVHAAIEARKMKELPPTTDVRSALKG